MSVSQVYGLLFLCSEITMISAFSLNIWNSINIVLASLSVCPSVCLSVRHTFLSILYLLKPWWDLQITLHTCQVWWVNVQCLCMTKVSSAQGHSSSLNIVWLYYDCVCSITLEGLVTIWNDLAQRYKTMRRCAECVFDQNHFQVKMIVQDRTHYRIFWTSDGIYK